MNQASFVFQIGGSQCVSTIDCISSTATDAEVAEFLEGWHLATWGTYMAQQCVLEEIRYGDAVRAVGLGGDGEVNSLPANCAIIVQKNTGTSVRGRMMLPGLAEADCDAGGRVGTELRGLLDAAYASAYSSWAGADILPFVKSTVGSMPEPTITSFSARPLVATLRNRVVTR